jgi:Tol biopolymer transport system component
MSITFKCMVRIQSNASSLGHCPAGRRPFWGSLAVLTLASFLAGCGGSSSSPGPGPLLGTVGFQSRRALDGSDAVNPSFSTSNAWVVKTDGSGATPLTKITASRGDSVAPAWTRDGLKIVFSSARALDGSDAGNTTANIWVMNADGSGATPLTKITALGADSTNPAWSPDGTKIAFMSARALDGSDAANTNNTKNIWVVKSDGSGATPLTKLTANNANSAFPAWSPDGSKIAFGSARALDGSDTANPAANVWVINADGSSATALTKLTAGGVASSLPVWSPNGAKLAFVATRALDGSDAGNTNLAPNVWLMNSDGSSQAPLTRLTAAGLLSLGAGFVDPVWSPSGAKIAFDSARALDGSDAANTNSTTNVWVMNADGSGATPLTRLTVANAHATRPAWSADGNKIAFDSARALSGADAANTNNTANIWLMTSDGSAATPLTKLTASRADCAAATWHP